jgi:multicomponent Na+:H+ antiporter subunit C
MNVILILAISFSVSAGVWLLLSRDLYRIIVGLAILGSAANLVLFMSGNPGTLIPPVIPEGQQLLAQNAANPLPQALVLTAIVIGFALLCYALVLGARLSREHAHGNAAKLRASEPVTKPESEDPNRPPVLEDP